MESRGYCPLVAHISSGTRKFPMEADSSDGGLNYSFQGTSNAKVSEKNSFFTFQRGASMLR